MKNTMRLLAASAAAVLLSGCYVNLATPTPNLSIKLDAQEVNKRGSAACTGFLWVFATGDCSVHSAMRSGRITKVHHVDTETRVILWGAYSELNLVVHGE